MVTVFQGAVGTGFKGNSDAKDNDKFAWQVKSVFPVMSQGEKKRIGLRNPMGYN